MIRHGVFISNAISRGKNLAKDYHELYPIPQQTIYELKIKQMMATNQRNLLKKRLSGLYAASFSLDRYLPKRYIRHTG